MSEQSAVDTPDVTPRMLVMGVGSSGARAVASMCHHGLELDIVAIDTDATVLESIQMEKTIQVGGTITRGLSAGGDVELGRQSIEKDSSGIRNQLRQVDLLVIVTGLGGGTGSGAVPVITRIAREAGALVLCMASLPFTFEGKKAAKVADESLKRIRTHADAIIRIPNALLVDRSDSDLPAEEAFDRSHQIMTEGIFALSRMLTQSGVCGLDFACIQTMLRNCDGFCHFATVEASGSDRAMNIADMILQHRLLNQGKVIRASAGIIVGLTGGQDMRLSEIEAVMNQIQELLPDDVWINLGVNIDLTFEDRLSAIVLVAEEWREPLVDSAGRQMGFSFGGRQAGGQGELPLEMVGKGRFSNLNPTIHDNQDLDVPAYIRRDIKLPR